jgi:hypothetical protein
VRGVWSNNSTLIDNRAEAQVPALSPVSVTGRGPGAVPVPVWVWGDGTTHRIHNDEMLFRASLTDVSQDIILYKGDVELE